MSYQKTTIARLLQRVKETKVCLPAIQRKYIWDEEQIENLFDSIYRGFPIGTFLFWELNTESAIKYEFYRILSSYDERIGIFNEKCPKPIAGSPLDLWSVLDGQQRITSIFIALQSSFRFQSKRLKVNEYIDKHLYFNLLGYDTSREGNRIFSLMTEQEARESTNGAWVLARNFLLPTWSETHHDIMGIENAFQTLLHQHPQFNNILKPILDQGNIENYIRSHVKKIVRLLQDDDNTISYYLIPSRIKLNEVTEIFIRINSGGTVLSKSDLLFSTVITSWQDGRKIIDDLIAEIGDMGFEVDTDFIIRTCLYLVDKPVVISVDAFKEEIVNLIIQSFENENDIDIKRSVKTVFNFLKEKLKINGKILKSKNSLIPLIYHVYKGGKFDENQIQQVKIYLYTAHLQKVFGSHGDTLLAELRKGVLKDGNYILKNKDFNFAKVVSGVEEKRELFNITDQHIDKWLTYKKGNDALMVLSLLYIDNDFNLDFDQDHLHPKSQFKKENLGDQYDLAIGMRDMVPNLCLLTPFENRGRKSSMLLKSYINEELEKKGISRKDFFNKHCIPANNSLEIKDFLSFFEERSKIIKRKLIVNLIGEVRSDSNLTNESNTGNADTDDPELMVIDLSEPALPETHPIGVEIGNAYSYICKDDTTDRKWFDFFLGKLESDYKFVIHNTPFESEIEYLRNHNNPPVKDLMRFVQKISSYLHIGEAVFYFKKNQ